MSTQRYSVTPHPIETLLTWVKSGEIAIPEIQRPFVWDATKVRNLLDSLYQGYPVGYLIAWRNPTVKLKDGTSSAGKRILIDGQQRVTALMAALLGREVLTKDYETVRIRIAFHPQEERFEVANPAIRKDVAWIEDVADVFAPDASLTELTDAYTEKNPTADRKRVSRVLEKLRKIINNHVGVIELAEDLDIETVTEIFIRVNSAGTELSQADFAMSKIAVNETYGGNLLRKAIDYFCHLAVAPEFLTRIEKSDKAFAASEFLPAMRWLKDVNDDIYDPTYTDMLRVAFTSEFGRGKLQDLVALLSGRNFETKQFEEAIAEESFGKLKKGVHEQPDQRPQRGQLRLYPLPARAHRGHARRRPRAARAPLVCHVRAARPVHGQPRDGLRLRHPPGRGARARELRRCGDRERAAGQLLDRDAAAAHGHLVVEQPLLPLLPGGAGEARRQGLSLARHHRA